MSNRTFLIVLLLLVSCQRTSSPPQGLLPDDRFRSVYIALLVESERLKIAPGDTTRHFNADSIFRSFNTSEAEFRRTVESYKASPARWQAFYEGVIRELDEQQKQKAAKARR